MRRNTFKVGKEGRDSDASPFGEWKGGGAGGGGGGGRGGLSGGGERSLSGLGDGRFDARGGGLAGMGMGRDQNGGLSRLGDIREDRRTLSGLGAGRNDYEARGKFSGPQEKEGGYSFGGRWHVLPPLGPMARLQMHPEARVSSRSPLLGILLPPAGTGRLGRTMHLPWG